MTQSTFVRWTPKRKTEIVGAVMRGEIALDDVLHKYGISLEEYAEWARGSVRAKEVAR